MRRLTLTTSTLLIALLALFGLAGVTGASSNASPPEPLAPTAGAPTVVSYQGQVTVGGAPYAGPTGVFKFAIVNQAGNTTYWSHDNSSVNGGEPTTGVALNVTNGLFNVLLGDTTIMPQSLPASVFSGPDRYLRVWFSTTGAAGAFTLLTPDRRIAAVPYALQAEEVKNAWTLIGNAGTTAGTNFLGTTDNTALQVHVNGQRALRIEPNASSPNLIGGYSGNGVISGAVGATIGGGGAGGNVNRVTDDYGVVGGGYGNGAGDMAGGTNDRPYATVGGGMDNYAAGSYSFVGGGTGNRALGLETTIAGGAGNSANNIFATVAGGGSNTADGYAATVPGGVNNTATGNYSFAAGFRAKAPYNGSFVWADATDADFSATGGNQFAVRATGGVRFSTGAAAVTVNDNTVWHAGNDGATSTLDADLLDGQHASAFATTSHSHDHGALTGLADDDHPQYFNLGQNETVSGIPAFNGGVSGASAPFTVDSNYAVTNLNADLLDGQNGDYYRPRVATAISGATVDLTGSCANYTWISIDVPRAGTVIVEGSAWMELSHVSGTKDEMILLLDNVATNCYNAYDEVHWTFTAGYPAFSYDNFTFAVRRAFSVTAGTNTFYLNGMMFSGAPATPDDRFWYASLQATFYPQ